VICDFRSDHNLDHLQVWTTWELWTLQHIKARVSDEKARKSTQNEAKNRCFCVWDVDAAGSNPVTPTISSVHSESEEHSIFFCLYFIVWSSSSALFSFVMPWWADSLPLRPA
jgi:hypothetical protein